jgi:uroporphyrinogen III methyltransferase/synthase
VRPGAVTARPLEGRRVLVTRRPEQSERVVAGLRELGATVVEVPTLELAPPEDMAPLDRALRRLHRYDWLVFTSGNAVRSVRTRLSELGMDAGAIGRALPVASVGPATSEVVRELFPGGDVSLEPSTGFQAEALLEVFTVRGCAGQRFLLPTSSRARDLLPKGLTALGAEVEVLVAYRTVSPEGVADRLTEALGGGIELAVFASPSAVEGFLAALGERAAGLPSAVIGPVTERAARAGGLDVRVVATPSTGQGLLDAVARHYAGFAVEW